MYEPAPIDTSHVELDSDLTALIEKLAAHNHDIWAAKHMKEGWHYGQSRNDELKETPCLVHYDELPELEKDYDRAAAIETIKALIALGYRVLPQ